MKKIFNYTLIIFLVIFAVACKAQIFSSNTLIGTKWESEKDGATYAYEFTRDSILLSLYDIYTADTLRFAKSYYLTNNKNESFDSTKVGIETFGKFLLMYNKKMKCKEYCEIKESSSDTLVLFFEEEDGYVGAANIYFTYRRVK